LTVTIGRTLWSEGTDSLTFTYDGLGHPDQVLRGSTVLTDYTWNPDGTLASRVDGTSGTSSFTADWAGRLATMSAPLWSGSLTWAYRLDGLPDWRSWPSGSAGAATYAYDGAKRPTSVTKAGTAAATFSQAYDRDGNVTAEGRTLAGVSGDAGTGSQAFAYDGLSRVTGSTGLAATYGYGYDRDGNRTSASVGGATTTYAYDRTGILRTRLDGGTTTYYAADGYGNLTSNAHAVNQVTTNAYDLGDRLTAVTLPGGGNTTTSFTFDALGRIATRTGPGAPTETYGYVGTSDTVGQIADGSTTISSGLTPDGERVATGSGGTTGFLLADLHGNQGAVVNAAESAIVGATRYDPYGLTAASWSGSGSVPTPWRYQGRLDISANPADPLYVAGARDYLPATGTFISLDSFPGAIGNPASLNRYLYTNANPTSLIDPSGHRALSGTDYVDSAFTTSATATSPPRILSPAPPIPSPTTPPMPTATPAPEDSHNSVRWNIDLSGLVPCNPAALGAGLAEDLLGALAVAGGILTVYFTGTLGTPVAVFEFGFGLYHIYEGQASVYEGYHCE
jgi:RHS repeat-associated protein